MNHLRGIGVWTTVLLLVVIPMGTLSLVLHGSAEPTLSLLFVSCERDREIDRTVEGAQAAARELGIDLRVATLISEDQPDQQRSWVRDFAVADYDGVAVCSTNPGSRTDLINDIAARTKVVTIGEDLKSNRLFSVGFSPYASGGRIMHMVGDKWPESGKILLLSSTTREANRSKGDKRLVGFQEAWADERNNPWYKRDLTFVTIALDTTDRVDCAPKLSEHLADPALGLIIAFDAQAAEIILAVLSQQPRTSQVPFFVFDATTIVLNAVDSGLVDSVIDEDPYHSGYFAVKRLIRLCRCGPMELPAPRYGTEILIGDVITESNIDSFRKHAQSRRTYFVHPS